MDARHSPSCTAFAGVERFASGDPREVALACKRLVDAGDARIVLVFDDATAEPVEFDLRGDAQEILRLPSGASAIATDAGQAAPAPRTPGRPKLGVVGREVTLLPRHWAWLNAQPGGASVALRKLVERALRENKDSDRVRRSREVAFRFMSAMAGNEAGFEEAVRALFAGDRGRFEQCTMSWPPDVRGYARSLATDSFAADGGSVE